MNDPRMLLVSVCVCVKEKEKRKRERAVGEVGACVRPSARDDCVSVNISI